jgi:hypothetical protein
MEFYNYNTGLTAGYAKDIWPTISEKYAKNPTLGIRQVVSLSKNPFNYKIIPYNIDNEQAPLFAKGTFTAIYKLKNIRDITDETKYILRIYKRDQDVNMHLLNTPKIKKEYSLFDKYLINIHGYGTIMINNFRYDYIITQEYNIVKYASKTDYTVTNLTNLEKIKIVYNNIIMLNDLYQNDMFHADYKLDNIGWDDNYNIILIDYDYGTIQEASKRNNLLELDENGRVSQYYFASTYTPDYIGRNGENYGIAVYRKKPRYYVMYSVGGLGQLIFNLNIKPNISQYPLDSNNNSIIKIPSNLISNQYIKEIYMNNDEGFIFPYSLYLFDKEYEHIPKYDDLLILLKYIIEKGFIQGVRIGYI